MPSAPPSNISTILGQLRPQHGTDAVPAKPSRHQRSRQRRSSGLSPSPLPRASPGLGRSRVYKRRTVPSSSPVNGVVRETQIIKWVRADKMLILEPEPLPERLTGFLSMKEGEFKSFWRRRTDVEVGKALRARSDWWEEKNARVEAVANEHREQWMVWRKEWVKLQEELRLCKERERKLMGEKQWLTELAAAGQ